jgi:hypothetical protein
MDLKRLACHPEANSAPQVTCEIVQPIDPDFRVLKSDAATWKIVAVSPRARDFMHRHLAPGGDAAQTGVVFTDHRGVNDFMLHVRTRGYTARCACDARTKIILAAKGAGAVGRSDYLLIKRDGGCAVDCSGKDCLGS